MMTKPYLARHLPNSKSCMRMGGSEMVTSWLSDPSASDFDPQGNLAKVDKEDVATYY